MLTDKSLGGFATGWFGLLALLWWIHYDPFAPFPTWLKVITALSFVPMALKSFNEMTAKEKEKNEHDRFLESLSEEERIDFKKFVHKKIEERVDGIVSTSLQRMLYLDHKAFSARNATVDAEE